MIFRIAVVQFRITHLNPNTNFHRIEKFIAKAKKQKADVIVFPEDCITGSIFGDRSKLDANHHNRETFRSLAKKYSIDILTGSSMEETNKGNFNTGYYINFQGNVLGTYRKNHLYPSERAFLSPGTDVPVFDTAYGKAGIVICWDMLFPEIFARMRNQGVQIIYCPSYWYQEIAESIPNRDPKSEEHLLDALCLTRAVETNAALVYCNAAGVMKNPNGSIDTLIGHSQIAIPGIGATKRLLHRRETMFVHSLDIASLAASETVYT